MSRLSPDDIQRLVEARHHAPRSLLGFHVLVNEHGLREWVVRVFEPEAERVALFWEGESAEAARPLQRLHEGGLFEIYLEPLETLRPYRLVVDYKDGNREIKHDPYYFSPQLSDFDLYLFNEGNHLRIHHKLGAHPTAIDGVEGTLFAVWAPNAERVSVVGDFNYWDGRKHPMQVRGSSGVWELFIPGVGEGALYKYEIRSRSGVTLLKSDPYGVYMQKRPETASIVYDLDGYRWGDAAWMAERAARNVFEQPINIYEVHPGSWRRADGDRFLSYLELADELIPYVKEMGYTHIELMGIAEHPFDGSWGYQVTGYFAPTSRYGTPKDFMHFVDRCHQAGIGVIMDWVPGHFPTDAHGLAYFDGTHLYEHADPRLGEHRRWGTKVFNYGRNEVRNFLVANALYWLEYYHIDGLRVDAVASMLYLDYDRNPGEWLPNRYGGRENLEAIDFLKRCNEAIFRDHPGILSVAEESTAFPGVTQPTYLGGLGFNMKWNMGWMNDTLRYIELDPIYRRYEHHLLTFSLVYAWSEKYILPISHDEVVHGKRALLAKMPGDDWQKCANYRLYLTYMMGHPGKKLLFMGSEWGQWEEWNYAQSLNWHQLNYEFHQRLHRFCKALNRLYASLPQLYRADTDPYTFEWIDLHDHDASVYSFLRRAKPEDGLPPVVFVCNFTPVPRGGYAIGAPLPGVWRKVFDSDAPEFGGAGYNTQSRVPTEPVPWHGRDQRLVLDLPPLGVLVLVPESDS
ncbi:MAG: 1,4-alpha-glucan branching enzyme GlgB [Gammaproteobacteria bacterium]|nr:MAG: 1,4-alpha-glucan branching enzyme GlgB [Gammaproteobacteria bacterium]